MTLLIPDARRALFGGAIDFAGLLPPASLHERTAVETFRRIVTSTDGWMAGRLLCPASRLDDLAAALIAGIRRPEEPWRIGVVCDGAVGACASLGRGFHLEMDPAVTVEIAEASIFPGAAAEVVHETFLAICGINDRIVPYIEVDATHGSEAEMVDGIYSIAAARDLTRRRGGAKLTCSGVTGSPVPSPDRVAVFIDAATRAEIPFRFTSGLDRAIRGRDATTGTVHHGFMNLFAAAAVARAGGRLGQIEDAVADTDPTRFSVSFAGLRWDGHAIGGAELGALRARGLTSFSSPDFGEAVAALRSLGVVS